MQLHVTNSPFSQEQADQLNSLLPTLTEAQIQWLSGYLAFYRSNSNSVQQSVELSGQSSIQPVAAVPVIPALPKEATILFGSQTGNAQKLAGKLAEQLKTQGFEITLSAMNKYKPAGLKKTPFLFVFVSTHGEGDPPDNAISFYEFLHSKRAPELKDTKFGVLALGDTSYEFFCKTGQDFDAKLEQLGAQRLIDRIDCDVDYEEQAAEWIGQAVAKANEAAAGQASIVQAAQSVTASATGTVEYTRNAPFQAEVLENINLNGRGSDRETRHLELSLEGSGLQYEPGDALGIVPQNDPALVDEILALLNWNSEDKITVNKDGQTATLRDALIHHYEITVLSKPLVEKLVGFSGNAALGELVQADKAAEFKSYIGGRDLLDLLKDFGPWTLQPSDIPNVLRKIPARLYSIASSLKAHPEEVHLTIRKVEYDAHGRERKGVCSVYAAERLAAGDKVSVFVQSNPNFKLPSNPDAPVIMIGPGTGVAPFRAFMEEREEIGAAGKSWLFYGDRHFVTDFLYQTDWQRMHADGVLTKLEVAFSRDTEEKVYVQHRLLEHAAEVYQWIQDGAHLYICGDEKHMAHDVHQALVQIVMEQGGKSEEDAKGFISLLQDEGRYQRDVY